MSSAATWSRSLCERGEVAAFWEVLAQQPVGVLVRAALPWAARVAEVDGTPVVTLNWACSAVSSPWSQVNERRSCSGRVVIASALGIGVDDTGEVDQDSTALKVDHVLLAVKDLADAAVALNDRHGLASVEGGLHPQWGTANRIIPVDDAYLELITVVDPERARGSAFGRWVSSARPGIMQPLGWAVRAVDIDDVARRLDLAIESGSRATPDGGLLQWRLAGVDRAAADPALPFFIEWGGDASHPSQLPVTHSAGSVEFGRLELRGNRDRLVAWLGDHDLPVTIQRGRSSVTRVILEVSDREIVLDPIVR